ncbi:MAG: DUF2931 family protein [Bacteroidetes bacterium]|nr:DUF2931 family protein [Bacteroidota bacterium]
MNLMPTECAPVKYPMQIIKGNLITLNKFAIYIPDGKVINNGWGAKGSIHLTGKEIKPVPDFLEITWFSYTENKFYKGDFNLPQDKILQLFKEGFINPDDGKKLTYRYITVGLAPGGGVSVWLAGEKVSKEVCFLQAHDTDYTWTDFIPNPDYPREKFVRLMLSENLGPEEISAIERNGVPIDLWSKTYRVRYDWKPLVISKARPLNILVGYYNGEREFIDFQDKPKEIVYSRTIPGNFWLNWMGTDGSNYSAEGTFNEEEIFAAFTKLSTENPGQPIQLQLEVNDINASVKLFLRNEKFFIELVRYNINVYK